METYDVTARKLPVHLTLNEDLVAQVRAITHDLSAVVELLLADYIHEAKQRRAAAADAVRKTVAMWNRFGKRVGSFAADHSTL